MNTFAKKVSLFACTLFICMSFNLETWLNFSFSYLKKHEADLIAISTTSWVILAAILFFIYRKQLKRFNPRVFGLKRVSKKNRKIVIAGFITAILLSLFNRYLLPYMITTNQPLIHRAMTFYPTLATLTTAVFAPILNELVNRGIFFNLFFTKKTRKNNILGSLTSGLVYAASHGAIFSYDLIFYLLFGWILSMVYLKTKNLTFPIVLNMLISII